MSETKEDILVKDDLSKEDQKKFADYEKRLANFQEALLKLEEKYQVRAQMSYRMVYADLKVYEEVEEIKEKKDKLIDKAVEEIVNNNK
jgi:hypothetical protein